MQTGVFTQLRAAMCRYWATTNGTQRVLFVTGTLLFLVMAVHVVALALTGGAMRGPVSLRKPATFAETGWLMCWSVAWAVGVLGLGRGVRRVVAFGTLLFGTTETAWVGTQAWRGVPSHYNFATDFDAALFLIEGGVAAIFFVSTVVLLVAAFRARGIAPSLRLAILAGAGMVLCGCATGILMAANMSGIWEGAFFSNLARRRVNGYAGPPAGLVGGDLVMLHAVGLHGLMLISLAAWLLTYTTLPETERTRRTGLVVAIIVSAAVILTVQVFRVRPVGAFDPVATLLLAVLGVALLIVYGGIVARVIREGHFPALPVSPRGTVFDRGAAAA